MEMLSNSNHCLTSSLPVQSTDSLLFNFIKKEKRKKVVGKWFPGDGGDFVEGLLGELGMEFRFCCLLVFCIDLVVVLEDGRR